jgi:protein tyrosine/serine phosphatase
MGENITGLVVTGKLIRSLAGAKHSKKKAQYTQHSSAQALVSRNMIHLTNLNYLDQDSGQDRFAMPTNSEFSPPEYHISSE